MKLLIVTESRQVWGAELTLLEILQGISVFDVEPTVVVSEGSPFATVLDHAGIEFIEWDFALSAPNRKMGRRRRDVAGDFLSFFPRAFRLARLSRAFDAILVFSAWQLPEALVAGKLARKPIVFDLHETFRAGIRTRVLSVCCRLVRRVIAPSHSVLEVTGVSGSSTTAAVIPPAVIPRAVNVSPATRDSRPDWGNRPSIALVGQVVEHKRVLELITEIDWRSSKFGLRIIGAEPDASRRSSYEERVRQAARITDDAVTLVPRTSDVRSAVADCVAIINCSEHEAFGRTIAEGAVWGLYPIAVGRSGPAEIIEDIGFGSALNNFDELRTLLASSEIEDAMRQDAGDAAGRALKLYDLRQVQRRYAAEILGAVAP
jgi:glycosyltransferase involved in cell wall biosynthesis